MKKYMMIIGLSLTMALSAISTSAFAGETTTQDCERLGRMVSSEMSDAVVSTCLLKLSETNEKKQSLRDVVTNTSPEELSEIAKNYSSALGVMAKEVGMATNEFIKSDAGKIATYAVVWTVYGKDIKAIIITPFFMFIILMILFKGISTLATETKNIDGKLVTVQTRYSDMESSGAFAILIIIIVSMILSTVFLLNVFF